MAQEPSSEQNAYVFGGLVRHLRGAGQPERIFQLLEEKPYLAQQATHHGGFLQSGTDLETFALPAVIERGDWDRFLHYAALAANLRGLAEALGEPEILIALVREDPSSKLAQNSLEAIVDPIRRAQARALLAAAAGPVQAGAPVVHEITEDIAAVAAADRTAVLCAVARRLRADLPAVWAVWIERWVSDSSDRSAVWQAVAAGLLDCASPPDGVWRALAEIRDPKIVLHLAPVRLGSLADGDAAWHLERLAALFPDGDHRWLAVVRFLESLAERRLPEALALWQEFAAHRAVPWSAELIDTGRSLFGHLSADRIEAIAASLPDVESRAALRVAALAAEPSPERTAATLHAVGLVSPGDARLHWSLRFLEARPPEPTEEVRRQARAVLLYLKEIRYEAPAGDVRRALDLTARHLGEELDRQIENAVWSPSTGPDTLRTWAAEAETELVLAHLLEHAERYAAGVAPTEAEGFLLRSELIIRLTCSLCRLRGDLHWLKIAAGRLLPEEEDDLRAELARDLAQIPSLLPQVCEGIGDRRRKLLAWLSSVPAERRPDELLSMPSLYQSLADVYRVQDERLALAALLETPHTPRELVQRSIGRMKDREEQIPALLRFARHAIAFEASAHPERPDRLAVIEMVRDRLAIGRDDRLAALTPDIAALGSQAGGARAVAEHQEAARRLLGLETVSWPDRLSSFERMLAGLPETFSTLGESPRRRDRRIAAILDSIARLPAQLEKPAARAELQLHWHEELPIVLAAADRLPAREARALDRSLRLGLAAVPASAVADLCLLERTARLPRIDALLADVTVPPALLHACLYLLATPAPDRIQEIVRRLPQDQDRDARLLRLIRHGWLKPDLCTALLGEFVDADLALEARLWLPGDSKVWIKDLADLAAHRDLNPSDPSLGPLLLQLWKEDSGESRSPLASTVIDALRGGGRPRGESALRLWLHADLAPTMGRGQTDKTERITALEKALDRALTLAGAGP